MLSAKAKAIKEEKVSNILKVLMQLYTMISESYSPVKWSVLTQGFEVSPSIRTVLIDKGIVAVSKKHTNAFFYWQTKAMTPNWDLAESVYDSMENYKRTKASNKTMENNFNSIVERKKLIPINLNPVASKLPAIKKPVSESDSQRGKHFNRIEGRIEAIRKILYYCAMPRNSAELVAKLKEVTCGAPSLQWLKLNGWLLRTQEGKWGNPQEMDPSRFDEACLNKLKADLKEGKVGSVVDIRKATPQAPKHSKLVELQGKINKEMLTIKGTHSLEHLRVYAMGNLKEHTCYEILTWLINNMYFVYVSDYKFQVSSKNNISYEEVERMNREIKAKDISTLHLRERMGFEPVGFEPAEDEKQSFFELKKVIDNKILTIKQYRNDKFHHFSNTLLREGIKKEGQIIYWLINNNYLVYCGGGTHCPSFVPFKLSIDLIVVKSLLKDIEDGNKNTLGFLPEVIKKQIEDFETINSFNKDKGWPETTVTITEKPSSLSPVDALIAERIKFAKMLFKLGDVKGANEILEKEV